jgi:two-component system phosphate regulon response regulator PhoB
MNRQILVVEDEAPIREMITFVLEQNGFNCLEAENFEQGIAKIQVPYPDLILLDWMLPGGSGVKFAKQLKRNDYTRKIPIIMLTARSDEEDKVQGFEAGIDDYITKPFSPKELIARIKAVMRRVSPTALEEVIEYHGLALDPVAHRVTISSKPIDLGPTEFKLLHFFMTHPDRVYSREQLLDNVWGTNVYVEDRTVDVHIRRLRKAIAEDGHDAFIQTVRGAGYRFSYKHH